MQERRTPVQPTVGHIFVSVGSFPEIFSAEKEAKASKISPRPFPGWCCSFLSLTVPAESKANASKHFRRQFFKPSRTFHKLYSGVHLLLNNNFSTMTDVLSSFLPESFLDSVPCCGGSLPLKGMDIKLKYAVPKGIGLSGFNLDVALEITNPNKAPLSTTGFSYRVAQNKEDGVVFAEGSMDEGITLPAGETTQVVVPVQCSYGGVGSLGKSLLMGGNIDFVMSGDTDYKIPMTETAYKLPYRVAGSFAPTAKKTEEGEAAEEQK